MPQGDVVLVRRKYPPLGWALPGGFVEAGETAAAAARRELREETGLDVELIELFHVYSDPARDPRGPTLGVVFIGRSSGTPDGADDAAEARAFAIDALPAPLAFDHGLILADYRRYRLEGRRPPPDR
jgi:8-oxo-dGTP diphosphatase